MHYNNLLVFLQKKSKQINTDCFEIHCVVQYREENKISGFCDSLSEAQQLILEIPAFELFFIRFQKEKKICLYLKSLSSFGETISRLKLHQDGWNVTLLILGPVKMLGITLLIWSELKFQGLHKVIYISEVKRTTPLAHWRLCVVQTSLYPTCSWFIPGYWGMGSLTSVTSCSCCNIRGACKGMGFRL